MFFFSELWYSYQFWVLYSKGQKRVCLKVGPPSTPTSHGLSQDVKHILVKKRVIFTQIWGKKKEFMHRLFSPAHHVDLRHGLWCILFVPLFLKNTFNITVTICSTTTLASSTRILLFQWIVDFFSLLLMFWAQWPTGTSNLPTEVWPMARIDDPLNSSVGVSKLPCFEA